MEQYKTWWELHLIWDNCQKCTKYTTIGVTQANFTPKRTKKFQSGNDLLTLYKCQCLTINTLKGTKARDFDFLEND